MRSDLIFGAAKHIPNRYLLAGALAKAARALHRPGTRIQDTTNDVLVRFAHADQIAPYAGPPIAADVPSRSNKAQTSKAGASKHSEVSVIREAPQLQPEALKAPESRKRA